SSCKEARDLSRHRPDSCGSDHGRCGRAASVSYTPAVLGVLRLGDRDAFVVRLRARQSWSMGPCECPNDARIEPKPQRAAEVRLQGRRDHGHRPGYDCALESVRETSRERSEAESRQTHRGTSHRGDRAHAVEDQPGVRSDEASEASCIARLDDEAGASSNARRDRRRIAGRARFEGEHPSAAWPWANPEVLLAGYAPSELPNEAMANEGPDRRMVPALAGEHERFHLVANVDRNRLPNSQDAARETVGGF